MRNAKSKIRFIETFAIVTFPIALAVGCSATGEKPASIGLQEDVNIQQETDVSISDLNTLTYVETEQTVVEPQHTDSSIPESDDTQVAESVDSPLQSESTIVETDMMQVNLQIPEPAKLEKPQTSIIHYAFNQYDVDEQDQELLKAHADYLLENPDVVVNVNGYSDNRGSAKNNFAVSKKRAQQVADILMSFGVPATQIQVNGYGESFPLNDENNWDENRRVELLYSVDEESNGLIVSAF